jgi:hypothetical protein
MIKVWISNLNGGQENEDSQFGLVWNVQGKQTLLFS